MNEKPIFISGLYRSGTTLLTLILNQSKDLQMSYDTIHYLRFVYDKYSVNKDSIKIILEDINHRIRNRWDISLNVNKIISDLRSKKCLNHAVLYSEIMKSHLKLKSNCRWGDKTNVCWERIPDFINMFPFGRVIHIYRDPRDVLSSYKKFTNNPSNMYLDAVFSSCAMFNFVKGLKNNKNIFILKYEDLVDNPELYVRKICNFINIEFSEDMLFCKTFKQKDGNLFDSNSVFNPNRTKIDASSVGIWKKELSNLEIYLTELVTGDNITFFGYKPCNVRLNNSDLKNFADLVSSDYIRPRYDYWLKYKNGLQSYPNDNFYDRN